MIDFVTTRQETPEEAKYHLQLIAKWIAHNIMTAATPPTKEEQRVRRNEDIDARRAIEYLFGENTGFDKHAELIGSDADCLRLALLGDHDLTQPKLFDHKHRRVIKLRHMWRTEPHL